MSFLTMLRQTHNRASPSLRLSGNGEWVPAPRGGIRSCEAHGRPLLAEMGSRKAEKRTILFLLQLIMIIMYKESLQPASKLLKI